MTLSKPKKINFFILGLSLSVTMILLLACGPVFSQQSDAALERRVQALENYVATFQPTLVELSDNLNYSIQQYTRGLESSLENYSQALQRDLDQRLEGLGRKRVILNPFSTTYQSIETSTGIFLIAIEKVERIGKGVRLHVNIGNPNFADYNDFKLRFVWGRKRGGDYKISYEQWRQSLKGVDATFRGRLEKGKWNSLTVDLSPVGQGQLGYLECEMNVTSVELELGQ